MEKKEVFVTYTNTDCTEGRGADVPIAVCELEATAIRLGRKRYVQGSDGPIRKAELIELDGKWYYPSQAVYVVPPTKEEQGMHVDHNYSTIAAVAYAMPKQTYTLPDCGLGS